MTGVQTCALPICAPDGRVEYHYVLVDYLCHSIGDRITSGSDADEVRWVTTDDLPAYRLTEKATSMINKAFGIALAKPQPQNPNP